MNKASKSCESRFLVFALSPCSVLDDAIRRAKAKTQAIAGGQTYLSHPPHLTLYVSCFDSAEQVVERCITLVSKWVPPRLEITNWHHFAGDVLTGNQTLVCNLADECKSTFRGYQRELIHEIAEHRCIEESTERYRSYFNTLSAERQMAVESVGYPFTGNDWIPHLTIASISTSKWDAVWTELKKEPPIGHFHCPKMTIYRLKDNFPQIYREIQIGK